MNKSLFVILNLKRKLEGESVPLPADHDVRLIEGFLNQCLRPVQTKNVSGKFDRSCYSIDTLLKAFNELIKPNLTADPEWLPVVLGIEAGLLVAAKQLEFIKQKGG